MANAKLPAMMYIHGFRSGANGSKREQLQRHFEGRYRVIAPEVDADPETSLEKINGIIARERPEIIVGTSLGGWMTLMCDSGDARLVVVNPSTHPVHYAAHDTAECIAGKSDRIHALCSTADELIGDIHIRDLKSILPSDRLTIVNDFGHRCSGAGMTHLFEILDSIANHVGND